MCKVRCWRWLFGNKIPISLVQAATAKAQADKPEEDSKIAIPLAAYVQYQVQCITVVFFVY